MGGALPLTLTGLAGFGWLLVAIAGLQIALRLGGVPLLGQSAAVAAGAFLTASWTPGLPLLVAIALAVAATGLVGWLIGMLASLRSSGDPAVATWALGWLALTSASAGVFVSTEADLPIPVHLVVPAGGLTLELGTTGELVTALVFAMACLLGLHRVASGPLAARLALVRTNPEFAHAVGIPVAGIRAGALACGCALGALGGAGYLTLQGVSGPTDVSPTLSIELLAAVLVSSRRWWGVVAGALALEVLLHLTDPAIASAILIVAAVATNRRTPDTRRNDRRDISDGVEIMRTTKTKLPAGLSVANVSVTLGGREILTSFSLDVEAGEIHALIGPNGAGKTTGLRVIAGDVRGTKRMGAARAPGGVVRTLQSTPDTREINPRDLVTAATPSQPLAGFRHLVAAGSARVELARRTSLGVQALEVVGFAGPSSVDDRLLQLACAYATGASVIAMDEPAAGVDSERIAAAITAIAAAGRTVLLVEHDLRLVRQVADRASLLLAGRVVATGPVPGIFDDPLVRDAYLGVAVRAADGGTPG